MDESEGVLSTLDAEDSASVAFPSQLSRSFTLWPKHRSFVPIICTVGIGSPEPLINDPTDSSSLSDLEARAGGISAVQMKTAKAKVESACAWGA